MESSHTITDVVTSSVAAGLSDSHTNSDEDEIHSCLWVGCNSLSMNSLEEMITHIRDVHIGSGKVIINKISLEIITPFLIIFSNQK